MGSGQASMSEASAVSETAKREAVRASSGGWDWVDTTVWTERMLAALVNGVAGGKWYSRWPNAFFAGYGLFTMTEAHVLACQSR